MRHIVRHRFHVVEVVFARSGDDVERDNEGEREGELVAAMGLNADPDIEHLEAEVTEGVYLKNLGDDGSRGADENKLDWMEVLGDPAEGGVVLMMDGVNGPVSPPVSMEPVVEDTIAKVKDEETDRLVPEELHQQRGIIIEGERWPVHVLEDPSWYDVQGVVPHSQNHGVVELWYCHMDVLMKLVLTQPCPVFNTIHI